jgi:BirA family biotin operon repressor/biotin-[acetyl-CoA-carboxylase] ligase
MNCEMERVNFIIIGIGVNVNQDEMDFPPEIRDKATSLKLGSVRKVDRTNGLVRSSIIQKILLELEIRYNKILERDNQSIINEWKKYSVTIGRESKFLSKDIWYTGIAEDITEDGKLVVKRPDGVIAELVSGEISVRGLLGYT